MQTKDITSRVKKTCSESMSRNTKSRKAALGTGIDVQAGTGGARSTAISALLAAQLTARLTHALPAIQPVPQRCGNTASPYCCSLVPRCNFEPGPVRETVDARGRERGEPQRRKRRVARGGRASLARLHGRKILFTNNASPTRPVNLVFAENEYSSMLFRM